MALDLIRKIFTKSSADSEAKKNNHQKQVFTVKEPYSMAVQSINDGFFRAMFPGAPIADPVSNSEQQALAQVRKLFDESQPISAIPRLPSVIPKLMRSLRDPNAGAIDYVAIINKDPAMSAAVLKLANTVYFNPGNKRITAIETAVVKLGIEGLRSVLSAAVMQPVIQRDSPYFHRFGEQLWQHSLRCAVACERIAMARGVEPYKAYLLGLVHDIGTITAFSELCRELKERVGRDQPGYQVFTPLLREQAAPLSERIAREWEFPDVLCQALKQQIRIKSGDQVNVYAHILFQANLVCEVIAASEFHPPKAVEKLLRAMELPESLQQELDSLSVDV